MKPEDIHLLDFHRILIGEIPYTFLIEVIIRTSFIFIMLILSMRLMGKRMASQLSRNEMASLVSLAASVGIAIQAPDRGLVPAFIACMIVVIIQIGVAKFASKSETFEKLSQDETDILVLDGTLEYTCMEKTQMTRDRIYAQIRSEGIYNLGTVKRLYLEPNGVFTFVKDHDNKPGLCIIPEWDTDFREEIPTSTLMISCGHCGFTHHHSSPHLDCPKCHRLEWTPSVLS